MIAELKKSTEARMHKSVEAFKADLAKVRTGRAHTGLLDHITVDYYGAQTPLAQVAKNTLLDARTIGVQPFEKKLGQAIEKAIRYLEEGKVVIFAAGTGNPFFTTDTAAALRASEVGAEIVLKGTKVDGVYTSDPKKDQGATRYARISFDDAIAQNLKVMDATALTLCRDQKLPINVFSIFKAGALKRVVMGEDEGTLVHS